MPCRVISNPDRLGFLAERPFAHRGLHDPATGIVENTAESFLAAIEKGYAIECDVVLAGDGEAVVFHDDRLERLTTGTGRTDAYSVAELKAISFRQAGATGFLTLSELAELVDGRVPLLVEMKSYWNGEARLAERTVAHLRDYPGALAVMSFDPVLLAQVRLLAPEMVLGLTACPFTHAFWRGVLPTPLRISLQMMDHLEMTRPEFISFDADALPSWQTTMFRRAGLPVLSWTVRDQRKAHHVRRYADQITFEGFQPLVGSCA